MAKDWEKTVRECGGRIFNAEFASFARTPSETKVPNARKRRERKTGLKGKRSSDATGLSGQAIEAHKREHIP